MYIEGNFSLQKRFPVIVGTILLLIGKSVVRLIYPDDQIRVNYEPCMVELRKYFIACHKYLLCENYIV